MTTFNPSPQQKSVLQKLNLFLASPGGGVFILKGYAGTGKTTLLQQFALGLKKEKKPFVLLAPTGRAATVLKAKTGLEAKTVHSELYLYSNTDGEPDDDLENPDISEFGQMRLLYQLRTHNADDKKLYIVDEASMISDEPGDATSYAHFGSGHLLSDLLQIVGSNKIIFAGDPSQLPPVGSIESPALSESWMKKQGKLVESFELTDILRQKEGSAILQLAGKLRTLTQMKDYPKWVKLPARNSNRVKLMQYDEMKAAYMSHVKQHGVSNGMAVCHSNYNCMDINRTVRRFLYNNHNALLQPGDVLMVTQNNYLVPFSNGDFATVVEVGAVVEYSGIKFIHARVSAHLTGMEYKVLLCAEVLYNAQSNLDPEKQRMLMINFSMGMRAAGIKPKSPAFQEHMRNDPYLNSLRANFGYAVTCHKGQGGEWDHVFLFLQKGMYAMGPEALTRWWYTGITRAREHLYITNDWWVG